MYNCRSVVTNFLFSFSLSFSFFFTHVEQMETGSSNDAHVGKCVSTVSSSVGKGNRAIKPRHCFERNGPRKSRERSTDFMRRGHSPLNLKHDSIFGGMFRDLDISIRRINRSLQHLYDILSRTGLQTTTPVISYLNERES